MQLRSLIFALIPVAAFASDAPYAITYSHRMEEPGNLEIAFHHFDPDARPAAGKAD